MSDETTLLPCPWCGEYPKVAEDGGSAGPWFCVWHDCPPVEGGKARYYGESFGCISISTTWFHTEAEAIAAWNARTLSMLSAEQVREAIERNFGKVAVIDDGGEKVEWREGWVCKVAFNSQAIADELNAELGSGMCGIVKTWSDSDYVDDWRYRCSECGGFIPVNERDPDTGDVINAANYCPNCGRKVVGEC